MHTRAILLSSLFAALALAGCERDGGGTPEAALVPSADAAAVVVESCPAGQPAAVCTDQKLAALHAQVKQGLTQAAEKLSAAGARIVADNQKAWLDAQRVVCGVDGAAATLTPDQENCLSSALTDRAKNAATVVEKVGATPSSASRVFRPPKCQPARWVSTPCRADRTR
jgi:hypothetical protein